MAYLCALLEQQPFSKSKPLSHKYEVIKCFLESVVHVVPLESVLFTIANGSHDTAMSCFEALKSCHLDMPVSQLMYEGSRLAKLRMLHGISGDTVKQLEKQTKEDRLTSFTVSTMHMQSNRASISRKPRVPGLLRPLISEPMATASIELEEILPVTEQTREASKYLGKLHATCALEVDQQILSSSWDLKVLSGLDIDELYPIRHDSQKQLSAALSSPLRILSSGRRELCTFLGETQETRTASTLKRRKSKRKMLEVVNGIRRKDLDICVSLLGAFMQQQEIEIILTYSTLNNKAAVSVGVWALFSLDYSRVQPLLVRCKENKLLVKIEDYIKGMSGEAPQDSQYAAKLQFMVQGMRKTVTCNSQYISYSLERQLVAVCKERNIDASIPLDTLVKKWGSFFKENTLSLVHGYYRPLIARWLKWTLMIHNLREELAKCTAIGVVGLINSGKSKLVNALFDIQVSTILLLCTLITNMYTCVF